MRAPLAPIPSPTARFAATGPVPVCRNASIRLLARRHKHFFTIATSARTTFSNAQNNKDGSVDPAAGNSRVPYIKIDRQSGNHANKTYKWKLYVHHEQARSAQGGGREVYRLLLSRVSTVFKASSKFVCILLIYYKLTHCGAVACCRLSK